MSKLDGLRRPDAEYAGSEVLIRWILKVRVSCLRIDSESNGIQGTWCQLKDDFAIDPTRSAWMPTIPRATVAGQADRVRQGE